MPPTCTSIYAAQRLRDAMGCDCWVRGAAAHLAAAVLRNVLEQLPATARRTPLSGEASVSSQCRPTRSMTHACVGPTPWQVAQLALQALHAGVWFFELDAVQGRWTDSTQPTAQLDGGRDAPLPARARHPELRLSQIESASGTRARKPSSSAPPSAVCQPASPRPRPRAAAAKGRKNQSAARHADCERLAICGRTRCHMYARVVGAERSLCYMREPLCHCLLVKPGLHIMTHALAQ